MIAKLRGEILPYVSRGGLKLQHALSHFGLLPEIVEGTETTHPLSEAAATATGLAAGTPVSLAYVDMAMTGLGAGLYTGEGGAACTIIGSTGVHMEAKPAGEVHLNAEGTGYVMALPVPGMVAQAQTNMAAALNIDWALRLAADLMVLAGVTAFSLYALKPEERGTALLPLTKPALLLSLLGLLLSGGVDSSLILSILAARGWAEQAKP